MGFVTPKEGGGLEHLILVRHRAINIDKKLHKEGWYWQYGELDK